MTTGHSPAELIRTLAVLSESPGEAQLRLGRLTGLPGRPRGEEHTRLFVQELVPYASVYLGPEGMIGGEAADRIAGFWRALGSDPPVEPDHLGALLGLYAALAEAAVAGADTPRGALRRHAADALLHEHLLPWLPQWLGCVSELDSGFYGAWARLLEKVLLDEVRSRGAPAVLPTHLSAAPSLTDPRGPLGAGDLLGELLAPVRTGLLITRSDLTRAAHALGLGLRMGERRRLLGALLSQDPSGILRWLAGHASAWAAKHRRRGSVLGPITPFWAQRAAGTASLLEVLAREAARAEARPSVLETSP